MQQKKLEIPIDVMKMMCKEVTYFVISFIMYNLLSAYHPCIMKWSVTKLHAKQYFIIDSYIKEVKCKPQFAEDLRPT